MVNCIFFYVVVCGYYIDVVFMLIFYGVNVYLVYKNGWFFLYCVGGGGVCVVKVLFINGCDWVFGVI